VEPGLLAMCHRGGVPNSNECQFYVTLGAPLSFLDGQNVVFGRVIDGFRVFKVIEKMDLVNERPNPGVMIEEAGVYKIETLKSKK
jgi:cyclophilin family peptidyl-prolyl cis-trans isomerase